MKQTSAMQARNQKAYPSPATRNQKSKKRREKMHSSKLENSEEVKIMVHTPYRESKEQKAEKRVEIQRTNSR